MTSGSARLNVVAIAAECSPYASAGGISAVVPELARAMQGLSVRHGGPVAVRVIIPRYTRGGAGRLCYKDFERWGTLPVSSAAWGERPAEVYRLREGEVEVFALGYGAVVRRDADLYEAVPDAAAGPVSFAEQVRARRTAAKFGFFCAAAVRLLQHWSEDEGWPPHVVHLHDWPAGLVAALLEPDHAPTGWWPCWDGVRMW